MSFILRKQMMQEWVNILSPVSKSQNALEMLCIIEMGVIYFKILFRAEYCFLKTVILELNPHREAKVYYLSYVLKNC